MSTVSGQLEMLSGQSRFIVMESRVLRGNSIGLSEITDIISLLLLARLDQAGWDDDRALGLHAPHQESMSLHERLAHLSRVSILENPRC